MYIWEIVTLNQLFVRDSYTQIKFSKIIYLVAKQKEREKPTVILR